MVEDWYLPSADSRQPQPDPQSLGRLAAALCPRLRRSLDIASSAVGTGPNTPRWRIGWATCRPLWNQRIIASMSPTLGLNRPTTAAAVWITPGGSGKQKIRHLLWLFALLFVSDSATQSQLGNV